MELNFTDIPLIVYNNKENYFKFERKDFMDSLNINITNFEGPFDLLIHLIRKNKMDIKDIRISEITKEYIDYLNKAKILDLDIASEFLVVCATLLEIKSKEILPKYEEEVDDEDLKEKLVLRIEEYEKFQNISKYLEKKYNEDLFIFTKRPESIEEPEVDVKASLKDVTLNNIYDTYMHLLEMKQAKMNKSLTKRVTIERLSFNIEDKMDDIYRLVKNKDRIKFSYITMDSKSKAESIVMFLALLELTKNHIIKVYQEDVFSDIIIEKGESDGKIAAYD